MASGQSSPEEGEDLDQDSQSGEARPGRHLFSADDMEGLLKAIYASEDIQQPSTQVSAQDRLYRGLGRPQAKSFPVHQSFKDIILREWKEPEWKGTWAQDVEA